MPLFARRVAAVFSVGVTWFVLASCGGTAPTSPSSPSPGPTPSGAPATVRITTDSLTCYCTVGGTDINVRIDGIVAGQTTCATPQREFSIQSGSRSIEPCDPSGECWSKKTVTIGPNETYVYPVTCTQELAGIVQNR